MWYLLCFVLLGNTRLCPAVNYKCSNRPHAIQEELVRDLLWHLDTHRSVRMDGIHPRTWKELAGEVTKPLSIICRKSWLTGEVPGNCRLTSVTPICKKGWKEDPGNYKACRPDLGAREGADHLECDHTACTGQGDQTQPAGVQERQVLPDSLS